MGNQDTASIVIPAHNEASVIGRLLIGLADGAARGEFEVVVVCNGCIDNTAEVARAIAPAARVIELTEASKYVALVAGDQIASYFPRVYIDADVVIDADGVRALTAALREPGTLVAAPERQLDLHDTSWVIRAYHEVWQRLPPVRDGLYGRGVLAVDAAGFARIEDRPHVTGDDLYVHHAFTTVERRIVTTAHSEVRVPKTMKDLLRRRTRLALGNTEFTGYEGKHTNTTNRSARSLLRLIVQEPSLLPRLPIFLAVTAAGRGYARYLRLRSRPHGWLWDASNRS